MMQKCTIIIIICLKLSHIRVGLEPLFNGVLVKCTIIIIICLKLSHIRVGLEPLFDGVLVEYRVQSELDGLQWHALEEFLKDVDTLVSLLVVLGITPKGLFRGARGTLKLLSWRHLCVRVCVCVCVRVGTMNVRI